MIRVQARGPAEGEILIHEDIGQTWFGDGLTSKRFAEDLRKLDGARKITVRINSPGGSVNDGIAIYNALRSHGARIEVVVEGLAASIASIIAMAGDNIRMGAGAMMMIHSPWTVALGNAEQMRDVADVLEKHEDSLVDIYEKRSGMDRKALKDMLSAETWFTAAEAVENGFADEADTVDAEATSSARAKQDEHRASFKTFAEEFRANSAKLSPLQIAAALKSAAADATQQEPPVNKATPASVTTTDPPANPAPTPDGDAARREALASEQARRAAIRTAFGRYGESHRTLLDACLDDVGCSIDKAREQLLAKLGEQHQPLAQPSITGGQDARDKFKAGAELAISVRLNLAKRADAAGNEFLGLGMPELAIRALALIGVSTTGMSRSQIASKILASHTSSDFPQLMSNVAGKVLRAAYGNFPNTWNLWATAGSVSDFKVHPRIQLGSFDNLATIVEGGEFNYGSLKEDYENASAVTKGKGIALTRQMIVNDDLGAFQRRASLMGRAAARSVNTDAYAYLTSGSSNHGPTSTDTGQYFNATAVTTAGGHANLTGTGTAISVASLGVGRVAMRKQKDKGLKETLNIEPAVLLTPVGKEDLARQVIVSETDPASSNSRVANIYRNRFQVVSDPYLDGISATAWYLLANPADVAAFEVVFLDGVQEPFVDEMIDFDTDSMKFKVRLDYGVAIGDWRAGYKNAGA